MLRTLGLVTVLAISPVATAAEPPLPSGRDWQQASEIARQMYARGFLEGLNTGIGTVQAEQTGRAFGEAARDGKPAPTAFSIKLYPYKEEAVLNRMKSIYSDPQNVNLLWNDVGELALRMLDGQDIEWRLHLQRQARDHRNR
jgi:hypothetical protein